MAGAAQQDAHCVAACGSRGLAAASVTFVFSSCTAGQSHFPRKFDASVEFLVVVRPAAFDYFEALELQQQAAGPAPHAAASVRLLQPVARVAHELVAAAHCLDRGEGVQALRHAATVLHVQAQVHKRLPPVAHPLARQAPYFTRQFTLEHVLDEGGLAGGQAEQFSRFLVARVKQRAEQLVRVLLLRPVELLMLALQHADEFAGGEATDERFSFAGLHVAEEE